MNTRRQLAASRGRRRAVALTAAALAAVIALSGCGVERFAQAGSSSEVGVTHADLQAAYRDLAVVQPALDQIDFPLLPTLEPGDLLTLILVGPAVDAQWASLAAGQQNVDPTEFLISAQEQVWGEAELTSFDPHLIQAVDTFYKLGGMTEQSAVPPDPALWTLDMLTGFVLSADDEHLQDVTVNPRYGEWDEDLVAVVPTEPEWIDHDDSAADGTEPASN